MKQKVIAGLFWKILENGGSQGVQFVAAILLARLLTPAEYGTVGIIMIFITIANVIVQRVQHGPDPEAAGGRDVFFVGVFFQPWGGFWDVRPVVGRGSKDRRVLCHRRIVKDH